MQVNWNPYLPWIGIGIVAVLVGIWIYVRARKKRILFRKLLSVIAQQMHLQYPSIKPYPVTTLHGRYFSYEVAVEAKTQSDPHYPWIFRIHLELQHQLEGRLYIQSENKPAKIARLYGMEVIITGNSTFDNQILVCSTDEASAQLLFTPYLIERFMRVQFPPFHIDFHKHNAYAEITLHRTEDIALTSHLVALMVEIAEFLHQGKHSLEPFDPPPMAA
ncbi:MAG: hypothetical protein COV45_09030 [Deltaproteobacteria bacterium CG11_big_fil_rev_8_21_14_0_20_47_16]|nr:MAG: hypothetical protein COV45_09030 [Deltaproteobacteria bacterium CG11_big_fil_rev_8_21_14_0_20_47_16]